MTEPCVVPNHLAAIASAARPIEFDMHGNFARMAEAALTGVKAGQATMLTAPVAMPEGADVLRMNLGEDVFYQVDDPGQPNVEDELRYFLQVNRGPHQGQYSVDVSDVPLAFS